MGQSLSAVYLHAIFSTRDRTPFLEDLDVRQHLYGTLVQISEDMGSPPVRVGGVADHVHVLARFGRDVTQSDWIKELKRQSSLWVKSRFPDLREFGWQAGYGVFSVAPNDVEGLCHYIDTQDVHHQRSTFQDELRALLMENGVEFDEKYVWS